MKALSFGTPSPSPNHRTAVTRNHQLLDPARPETKTTFCVQGVISPLLANRYMNRFLRHWRNQGRGEVYRAHVVNYADDFVILSRGYAAEALAWTRQVMTRLGLTVNETKTAVRDARQEHFDFLGYSFGPQHYRKDGHWYLGRARHRRACNASRSAWGRFSSPPTSRPGTRCAPG